MCHPLSLPRGGFALYHHRAHHSPLPHSECHSPDIHAGCHHHYYQPASQPLGYLAILPRARVLPDEWMSPLPNPSCNFYVAYLPELLLHLGRASCEPQQSKICIYAMLDVIREGCGSSSPAHCFLWVTKNIYRLGY